MPGRLLVVATPLGNLEDLSSRAVTALREAACIVCEDTRRTARLLARFEIRTPTVSCHRFNERSRIGPVLAKIHAGQDIALVSDGGTPGISDPGAALVEAALEAGVDVSPVPGPSASIALLSVSGLPADRFVFEGFLPSRAGERRRRLREMVSERRTMVFYEAPHRVRDTLVDMAAILGERRSALGRELTKLHETVLRGTPAELLLALGDSEVPGEITLAVGGAPEGTTHGGADVDETARLLEAWRESLAACSGERKPALRRAARILKMERSELFRRLAELGEDADRT